MVFPQSPFRRRPIGEAQQQEMREGVVLILWSWFFDLISG
jgi:hypothetical protein